MDTPKTTDEIIEDEITAHDQCSSNDLREFTMVLTNNEPTFSVADIRNILIPALNNAIGDGVILKEEQWTHQ